MLREVRLMQARLGHQLRHRALSVEEGIQYDEAGGFRKDSEAFSDQFEYFGGEFARHWVVRGDAFRNYIATW
jgi:hypothetical protein